MDHCGFNAKTDDQICKNVNNQDVINGERRDTQTHTYSDSKSSHRKVLFIISGLSYRFSLQPNQSSSAAYKILAHFIFLTEEKKKSMTSNRRLIFAGLT